MTDASVAFAKELIPPAWCSAPLKILATSTTQARSRF